MRATVDASRAPRASVTACLWILLAPVVLLPPSAGGQETQTEEARPPETPAVQPIAASQIPTRAEETNRVFRGIRERIAPSPDVERVRTELAALSAELEAMKQEPALSDLSAFSLRALDELDQRWDSADKRVRRLQTALSARATVLTEQLELARREREPWALTLAAERENELPEALTKRVRVVLGDIDAVRALISERLDVVLTIQNSISERLVTIEDVNLRVDQAKSVFRDARLIRIDGPLLWHVFRRDDGAPEGGVQVQLQQSGRQSLVNAAGYLQNYPDRMIAVVLVFALLSALLIYVRSRRRARQARYQDGHEDVIDVLSRPVASALLMSVLVAAYIFPNPPPALLDLIRMAGALPVYLIMRRVVPDEIRRPVYALILLYVVDMTSGLVAGKPLLGRLIDLLIAGTGLGVILWALAPGGWAASYRGGAYWQMTLRLLKAAALVLTLALVANVAGAVSLAGLLTDATLTSAYIGLGLYALILILQGLMDSLLHSRLAAKSRGISRNPDVIRAVFERLTNLLAAIAWTVGTLRAFRILDPVLDGLKTLFVSTISFGNFEISLVDVFAFVVALWAGLTISRILRFVLAEDVFPRVSLPRGVPSAISSMAHYTILTIAFFIALAVAGIELGKFALIAGAVGVGIGFGLQNIVNNFISGLILLFERPIQAGDVVEMGTLFGRVVRIGIRSSTVRTYQGAEVIVPNGDLIAKEVINWTLSDTHRRLEVPIGVTYNAHPKQVISILMDAARAHREVMREPDPWVLFVGYGASSIDFQLRCWVQSFNDSLRIQTELLVDIWDRLHEAGIEIPFPQQDLHLRSVDPEAAAILAGRPPSAPAAGDTPVGGGEPADKTEDRAEPRPTERHIRPDSTGGADGTS